MARIMGIDFGLKRTGISVTDPDQIIVNPLTTVGTENLIDYFKTYFSTEKVEKIVIGLPIHKDGQFTYLKTNIDKLVEVINKNWPEIKVEFADEQFTSSLAREIIFKSGAKKKTRQDKSLVDKISAVLILQKYLKHI